MARILFINGGSEGHINPTLGVVEELVSRGEEVVYFCIEAFRERVEKTGAAVRTFNGQKLIKAFISGGEIICLKESTVFYLQQISLYQAFLSRSKESITTISSMIPCLAADDCWLKCLSFLLSTLVLHLHRPKSHSIIPWNSFSKMSLQK